jgi:hypothetical protein
MPNDELALFHRYYNPASSPVMESVEARRRIYRFAYDAGVTDRSLRSLERELGVRFHVPDLSIGYYDFRSFTENAPFGLLLSALTIIKRDLIDQARANYTHSLPSDFIAFIKRVFAEEGLGYEIADSGLVRRKIDPNFDANRAAVIATLNGPKYQGVLAEIQKAYGFLLEAQPSTKEAVRAAFEAVETLGKLIWGQQKFPRLTEMYVKSEMLPWIEAQYAADKTAQTVAVNLGKAFGAWVTAMHPYRHGQESEVPVVTPFDVAVMVTDQASSYLRWLAGLHMRAMP